MVQFLIFVAFGLCVATGTPTAIADTVRPPTADMRYRGKWSKTSAYRRDDLVTYIHALWRCRVDICTKGEAPDYPQWEVAGPAARG